MVDKRVSDAVVRRLPRYYRQLLHLKYNGVERVSSKRLADEMRLNASQVRQDFNCFGGFGQQGYGYNVDILLDEIRSILGIDGRYGAVIVGAGNIGRALASFDGFEKDGFSVMALFDISEELIGTSVGGKPIYDVAELEDYIRENRIAIGLITARRSIAQTVADRMSAAGIEGIWNFAPVDVISTVPVENVHLTDSLMCLSFRMKHGM